MPKPAHRGTIIHQRHGTKYADPYGWLRADSWQEVVRDPETLPTNIREHLQAENRYADAFLADTKELQQALLSEMKGRIIPDESDVPTRDGPWYYSSEYQKGAEHPVFIRFATGKDGQPNIPQKEILLDSNALAKGHDFFEIGCLVHSPDHGKIAWTVDTKGSEYFEVFVRDLSSGITTDTGIRHATDDLLWMGDSQALLWIWRDAQSRPKQVRKHQLGTRPDGDPVLYTEADDGFFIGLSQTSDHRFGLIELRDHQTSEIHTVELNDPKAMPICLWSRTIGIEADADHGNGVFSVLTNADNAVDFQIVRSRSTPMDMARSKPFIAHQPGVLLLGQQQFANFHVRVERENALPRITIHDERDGSEHQIEFDDAAYALGLGGGYEYDTNWLRFAVSTPSRPRRVYEYNMQTRERILRKEQVLPSGHDPDKYVVERHFAPAQDGQMIPITLLRPVDMKSDGTNPLLLYGYGAYGISMPASFSANRLSLVDRGVVFAIAHVRGGKEKGFAWYDEGRRERKMNSFTDFIAVAEHLIEMKISAPKRMVAMGGSAGGMLMGVISNLRPELFAGIVAQVPFVDVLNTMSDASLPLTPPEWPEWGDPLHNVDDCTRIAGYCPITNVSNQAYPPIFATAGLTDTRVTWWEPAKWIAKLRYLAPDAGPFLLKTEMSAGHGGASGRYAGLVKVAEAQAFALKVLERTRLKP
ncbi:MAG: S9 family peptidase [Robiginitomaculum sp.]|nr:MAG: S9 family peptidase [Robiginitomaculum sp.]